MSALRVFVTMATVVMLQVSADHTEASCSPFEYDLKTLRTVVKLEHKVEQMEKKMVEWQTAMEEVLEKYKQPETKTLETKINGLIETVSAIQENIKRTNVAFMAELSQSLENPTPGSVVVFDRVHTNNGDAYNPSSGVFTAPKDGTYYFSIVASVPNNPRADMLHLFIMKDDVQVAYVFLDWNKTYWLRRSTDATLSLLQGNEIKVIVKRSSAARTLGGSHFHTQFSGFLVHADL